MKALIEPRPIFRQDQFGLFKLLCPLIIELIFAHSNVGVSPWTIE